MAPGTRIWLHNPTTDHDFRNAWGASAIDALSTALLMEQKDIVNQILDYVPTINYYNTSTEVSLFETTIRYLGGMVSGYDLLTGPLSHLADNVSNRIPLPFPLHLPFPNRDAHQTPNQSKKTSPPS